MLMVCLNINIFIVNKLYLGNLIKMYNTFEAGIMGISKFLNLHFLSLDLKNVSKYMYPCILSRKNTLVFILIILSENVNIQKHFL